MGAPDDMVTSFRKLLLGELPAIREEKTQKFFVVVQKMW